MKTKTKYKTKLPKPDKVLAIQNLGTVKIWNHDPCTAPDIVEAILEAFGDSDEKGTLEGLGVAK